MAFDSVRPDALEVALRRFGVGDFFADFIGNIYRNRNFRVVEGDDQSMSH